MNRHVFLDDESAMDRALTIARLGVGRVEPNPAVGCVITNAVGQQICEGYHQEFGGPHAEIMALRNATQPVTGSTVYVTLEPCSHHGKTPPCADALIAAGVQRVVVATADPAPHVAGSGIQRLRAAGIQVDVGCRAEPARQLIAPFSKLFTQGLPYVHAKWAMTLDGKIASRTGSSKWITNDRSRAVVHQLRGRMDAIISGIGTVLADDPQLTVRPPGLRVPTRVVLDTRARLPLDSQLAKTASEVPVLLFVGNQADQQDVAAREMLGVEVIRCPSDASSGRMSLTDVLRHLAKRNMTNVLLEAGTGVLGAFLDEGHVDEIHCFIAPKLIGGLHALSPFGGLGLESMHQALKLENQTVEQFDGDVYIHGSLKRVDSPPTS